MCELQKPPRVEVAKTKFGLWQIDFLALIHFPIVHYLPDALDTGLLLPEVTVIAAEVHLLLAAVEFEAGAQIRLKF